MWFLLAPLFGGLSASITKILIIFFTIKGAALVIKILGALGIGFVTYKLGTWGLDSLYAQATSMISGAPADFLALAKFTKIDQAMSILFGALAARLALSGFSNGSKILPSFT